MNAAARSWSKPKEWDNPVLRSWTRSPIDLRLKAFLELVDDLAVNLPWGPDNDWGIVSNPELMEIIECSADTVQRFWTAAEVGGFLKRVPIHSITGRPVGRVGFVWYRRPTARPTASPETFDQARARPRGRHQ